MFLGASMIRLLKLMVVSLLVFHFDQINGQVYNNDDDFFLKKIKSDNALNGELKNYLEMLPFNDFVSFSKNENNEPGKRDEIEIDIPVLTNKNVFTYNDGPMQYSNNRDSFLEKLLSVNNNDGIFGLQNEERNWLEEPNENMMESSSNNYFDSNLLDRLKQQTNRYLFNRQSIFQPIQQPIIIKFTEISEHEPKQHKNESNNLTTNEIVEPVSGKTEIETTTVVHKHHNSTQNTTTHSPNSSNSTNSTHSTHSSFIEHNITNSAHKLVRNISDSLFNSGDDLLNDIDKNFKEYRSKLDSKFDKLDDLNLLSKTDDDHFVQKRVHSKEMGNSR